MARSAIRRTYRSSRNRRASIRTRKNWKKKSTRMRNTKRSYASKSRTHNTGNKFYVPGIQRKLNNKSELFYTIQSFVTISHDIPNTYDVIWDPNTNFLATGTSTILQPTKATTTSANGTFKGDFINALSANVRFTIEVTDVLSANDYLRITVARPKVALNRNEAGGTLPPVPNSIISWWDLRTWNVMFDKTYGYTTQNSNLTPPKIFEFKIPLRGTIQYSPSLSKFLWDRPVYIFAVSRHGAQITMTNLSTKFFYRDP